VSLEIRDDAAKQIIELKDKFADRRRADNAKEQDAKWGIFGKVLLGSVSIIGVVSAIIFSIIRATGD
jgi:hypothetical protein